MALSVNENQLYTKNMDIIKKTLIALVGGVVITGTIILFDAQKPCGLELHDVSNSNLIEKMIEKVDSIEGQDKEYIYGCDLEPIKNGLKFSDVNCKQKDKDEWKKFKNDSIDKMKRLKDFEYNEIKQIREDFKDIWNYHVFEKCGFIEE